MATHSSVLAWRIPGTAEPGGLPSLGSHRVGHDWSDLAAAAIAAAAAICLNWYVQGHYETGPRGHTKLVSWTWETFFPTQMGFKGWDQLTTPWMSMNTQLLCSLWFKATPRKGSVFSGQGRNVSEAYSSWCQENINWQYLEAMRAVITVLGKLNLKGC